MDRRSDRAVSGGAHHPSRPEEGSARRPSRHRRDAQEESQVRDGTTRRAGCTGNRRAKISRVFQFERRGC